MLHEVGCWWTLGGLLGAHTNSLPAVRLEYPTLRGCLKSSYSPLPSYHSGSVNAMAIVALKKANVAFVSASCSEMPQKHEGQGKVASSAYT